MSDNHGRDLHFEWVENPERIGEKLFTFDGEKIFNLFRDYPYALTKEQKQVFDEKNPYWAEFLRIGVICKNNLR